VSDIVFTIGHSTQPIERFVSLLKQHEITAVSDVRSKPYSRMNPQFNRETLKATLRDHGIAYAFLGEELGARSKDRSCYENGKVQYGRLAETDLFRQGLKRVQEGASKFRIALMCAEKEPLDCHRTILVARYLGVLGIDVRHILGDGRLETHAAAVDRLIKQFRLPVDDMFSVRENIIDEAYRLQEQRVAYSEESAATHATGAEAIRSAAG